MAGDVEQSARALAMATFQHLLLLRPAYNSKHVEKVRNNSHNRERVRGAQPGDV